MVLWEVADGLVRNGCITQHLGGSKARASCGNGLYRTVVFSFIAGVFWWALHGTLLAFPTKSGWTRISSFAKYAGGTAGAIVSLLFVLPAAFVFFVYIIYPVLLLAATGVVFFGAWLLGHVVRALGA